jgi:histidinol-phosphate aminotransferase
MDSNSKAVAACVASAVAGGLLTYVALSTQRSSRPSPCGLNKGAKSVSERLARPNILSLTPYRCARDDYDQGILLDANENSFGPTQPPSAGNPLALERYPSPYQIPLKEKVAKLRGCSVDNIFVGVGSDEAIDLLFRVFCRPSTAEHVIVTPPTYGMYKVCAAVNDVGIREVPLDPDFNVRVDDVLRVADDNTKLIFICSPGNPTS